MQSIRDSVDVNNANKELVKALKTREKDGGGLDNLLTSSMVSSRRVTYLRNRTGTDLDSVSLTNLQ